METINSTLGKEFPQKAELELTRENHAAVIRELQRMQEDAEYVSEWKPKTIDKPESQSKAMSENVVPPETPSDVQKNAQWQKMEFTKDGSKIEYSASNQHNGYILEGYVLRKTSFNAQIGSLGQSFYEDGQWHTTATVPSGINLRKFDTIDNALAFARTEAQKHNLVPLGQNKPMENENMATRTRLSCA